VCTQPRRISALGLSDRVSAERCTEEGQEVGYIIRGDSRVSDDTRITFMTTGVLLRRLQSSPDFGTTLADLSHIFIDEVHERSLDTDFLLALLRDALKVRKDLKLVRFLLLFSRKIASKGEGIWRSSQLLKNL
jgi:ATP-dependent RNA helicase DHX57